MKVFTTIIDSTVDDSHEGKLTNEIFSVNETTSPAVSYAEMLITFDFKQSFLLDEITGPAFDQNFFSQLPVVQVDDVKFIHIQCRQVNLGQGSKYKPVFFNFTLGAVDLKKMSQVQFANLSEWTSNVIQVTNVEVAVGEKALLEVFIGINND